VARNPLSLLVHVAAGTVRHTIATTGKAVEQALETVAVGRMVAGQLTRTALSSAEWALDVVVGDRSTERPRGSGGPADASGSDPRTAAPVAEPGHPPTAERPEPRDGRPVAVAVDSPAKQQGDPLAPHPEAPARRAAAKKSAVRRAPVATRAPGRAAPEPAARSAAAQQPVKAARPAPAKKAATPDPVVAPVTASEPFAKKSTPGTGKKAVEPAGSSPRPPSKPAAPKAPATKAPAKRPAVPAPAAPATPPQDTGEPPVDESPVTVTPADVAKAVATSAGGRTTKKAADRNAAKKAAKKTAKKTAKAAKTAPPPEASTSNGPAEPEPDTVVYTSDSSGAAPDERPGDSDHLAQPLLDPSLAAVVRDELATGDEAAGPESDRSRSAAPGGAPHVGWGRHDCCSRDPPARQPASRPGPARRATRPGRRR
jgi:hypothetical protein